MEIYQDYEKIPEGILRKIGNRNIYLTKDYNRFIKRQGKRCIYFYDLGMIMPVILWKRTMFRFAVLPTNPLFLSEEMHEKYSNEEYFEAGFVERIRNGNIPQNEEEKEFILQMDKLLEKMVQWVCPTDTTAFFHAFPEGSLRIPFGSYIIDLSKSEDEIFSSMKKKSRNKIRHAEKKGVIVLKGLEYIEDFIKCDVAKWNRQLKEENMAAYYRIAAQKLGENAEIYVSVKDGAVQASHFYFISGDMAYTMYSGSMDDMEAGSKNLIHWTAICDFKKRGIKKYSFVGYRYDVDENSKFRGIQEFKESFGGYIKGGYMFKKIYDPVKYNLYCKLRDIKYKGIVQKDIIDQELHKWDCLN